MMTRFGLIALALLSAAPVSAEIATVRLTGPEITEALTDRALSYEAGIIQTFGADGVTRYADTTGRWRVEGDRYCSVWPPSESWACYDVFSIVGGIRFVGAGGDLTDGIYGAGAD